MFRFGQIELCCLDGLCQYLLKKYEPPHASNGIHVFLSKNQVDICICRYTLWNICIYTKCIANQATCGAMGMKWGCKSTIEKCHVVKCEWLTLFPFQKGGDPFPKPVYTIWSSLHWNTLGYHWATQRILAGYTGTPLERLIWNSPTLECHRVRGFWCVYYGDEVFPLSAMIYYPWQLPLCV